MSDSKIFQDGAGVILTKWVFRERKHIAFEAVCMCNEEHYLFIHKGNFCLMLEKQEPGSHIMIYGSTTSRKNKAFVYGSKLRPIQIVRASPTGQAFQVDKSR